MGYVRWAHAFAPCFIVALGMLVPQLGIFERLR